MSQLKRSVHRLASKLKEKLHPRRISKALGGALGGLTGATVVVLADEWLDLALTDAQGVTIATVLAAIGSYLAPKNRDARL